MFGNEDLAPRTAVGSAAELHLPVDDTTITSLKKWRIWLLESAMDYNAEFDLGCPNELAPYVRVGYLSAIAKVNGAYLAHAVSPYSHSIPASQDELFETVWEDQILEAFSQIGHQLGAVFSPFLWSHSFECVGQAIHFIADGSTVIPLVIQPCVSVHPPTAQHDLEMSVGAEEGKTFDPQDAPLKQHQPVEVTEVGRAAHVPKILPGSVGSEISQNLTTVNTETENDTLESTTSSHEPVQCADLTNAGAVESMAVDEKEIPPLAEAMGIQEMVPSTCEIDRAQLDNISTKSGNLAENVTTKVLAESEVTGPNSEQSMSVDPAENCTPSPKLDFHEAVQNNIEKYQVAAWWWSPEEGLDNVV